MSANAYRFLAATRRLRARRCDPFGFSQERIIQRASDAFDAINTDYLAVRKAKDDLFWTTYMATSNDDAAFAQAE